MRYIRALFAIAALLLLLFGLPLVLVLTVGNPASGWRDLLAGDTSATVVLACLATLAWLAWAQFALAVGGQVMALARNRPRVPVPGLLPGQQQLARMLVGAVFLMLPATAIGAGMASAAPAPASTAISLQADGPASVPRPTAANVPAGASMSDSGASACVIGVSGPATFWELAQVHLGDGQRWQEIWQLNRGRHQQDGTVLNSPGLLRPGWNILLPAVTTGPHQPGPGASITVAAIDDTIGAAPTPPPGADASGSLRVDTAGWAPSRSAAGDAMADPQREVGAAAASPAGAQGPVDNRTSSSSSPWTTFGAGAGSGLLVGVSASALTRRRRRQIRHRRPGRTIAGTPPGAVGVHKALIRGGPAAQAGAERLDLCLRDLTHQSARVDSALPDIRAVRLSSDAIDLVISGPGAGRDVAAPPPPWVLDPQTGYWRLVEGASPGHPQRHRRRRRRRCAPFPALVSIGADDLGGHWLIDLEAAGVVSLSGDAGRCQDLARHMGAELANSRWCEQIEVTLIGIGAELGALNPDRLSPTADALGVLEQIRAQVRLNHDVLNAHALADVLQGRAQEVAADQWMPHVLIVDTMALAAQAGAAHLFTVLDALADELLADAGRSAVALLRIGEHQRHDAVQGPKQGLRLQIDAQGRLDHADLGGSLRAAQLGEQDAGQLSALLGASTDLHDLPMPAARGDEPWQTLADAAGAPAPHLTRTRPGRRPNALVPAAPAPAAPAPEPGLEDTRGQSVLRAPGPPLLQASATTERDVGVLAPALGQQSARMITAVDPELDADLAQWHDPATTRARLRLLGPLQVRAQGRLPHERPRVAWHSEIVAYLFSHPRGCSVQQFGADLWPDDPYVGMKSTPRQSLSQTRRWLGADPRTGRNHIPPATPGGQGHYRVEGLLCDADLFARLRLRGVARGSDGIADLEAALTLVTGPPLDQRRGGGYAWLAETPLDIEYTAMIVDVAHLVATHHLIQGRPDHGGMAARVALMAGSTDDVALLDLVAACEALGHRQEADWWVRQILINNDAELEEDLPPRTFEILQRRRWIKRSD